MYFRPMLFDAARAKSQYFCNNGRSTTIGGFVRNSIRCMYAGNRDDDDDNAPIGGKNPRPIDPAKVYPKIVMRAAEAIDRRIGYWKFLRPIYDSDSAERRANVGLRMVYRDTLSSRAALARGIWMGYATTLLIPCAWIFDWGGFGTECWARPYGCIGVFFMGLSFLGYLQFSSQTFIASIHEIERSVSSKRIDLPPVLRIRNAVSSPEYVLTCAHSWTGMKQKIKFTLDDVRTIPQPSRPPSFWRYVLQLTNPLKEARYVIGNRRFELNRYGFTDNEFRTKFITSAESRATMTKGTKRKR